MRKIYLSLLCAALCAGLSACKSREHKPAVLVWWGGADVEIKSGDVSLLLNPYKNYYRAADYIVTSNNDSTSANRAMIEMLASVSPKLKAIIVQEAKWGDFGLLMPMAYNPTAQDTPAQLKKLTHVLAPGGTFKDGNLSVTAVPLDSGEATLLIRDKNSGLRYVYATYTGGYPAHSVAKALKLAGAPVDYLIADLTRLPQRDLREILQTYRPRYLLPIAYPYETVGISDEKTPDVTTMLPLIYGSRPAETAEALPYRVYYLVSSPKDMNVRYLPRFAGPLQRFIREAGLPTKIVAPRPGEEMDMTFPPELAELPPADIEPTTLPAKNQIGEPYDPLSVQPCPFRRGSARPSK